MEIGTMSAKFLPAIVAGLLLGTTALAARADAGLPAIRLQLRLQRIYPGLSARCHFWIRASSPGAYYAPG